MSGVLITGAGGYLGRCLARWYLQNTDARLFLWAHARGADELHEKNRALQAEFAPWTGRINCTGGDLTDDDPFAGVRPASVSTIVHAAAATRFNVDEETARRVNIEGTIKLLQFAERCPRLKALGLLSTLYASGLQPGRIVETPFSGEAGFANYYEQSKWAAEQELLAGFPHLPWYIFRLATVIADGSGGIVTQFNAFHHTLRLVYYGLLSLIPGNAETPVYLVTGEFVTEATGALMETASPRSIYHLTPSREHALTLGQLVDLAYAGFLEEADFRARRVLKPLLCDAESFALLAEGINTLGMGVVGQALGTLTPFARQLFVTKDIANDNLIAAWPGFHLPDLGQVAQKACAFLALSKWGKEPVAWS
jgi:thioester reductase-like protein